MFLIIGFSFIGFLFFNSTKPKAQYVPSDVIFGEKILAIHNMDMDTPILEGSTSSNQLKPEIQISEKYYDFGVVQMDQSVVHDFYIENCGQSTLVIQKAYTTCGCTTAEFSAKEIPPGKGILMTLYF